MPVKEINGRRFTANKFYRRADYKRMKKAALLTISICVILCLLPFAAGRLCKTRANGEYCDGHSDTAFAYGRDNECKGADEGICIKEQREGLRKEQKKAATLISSFTTTFNRNVYARSYNIALACKNFCYYTVHAGETLSFNAIVGKRTAERGYKEAKVIENGEYVPGVGGGVCQVSTTLYNAWITAGLGVVSVRAHSLPSSYCDMSRDATVSDWTDLVLINDSGADVIVNATVTGNKVAFYVYGEPSEYTYKFESVLVRRTHPPEPVLQYVDYIEGGLESKQISPAKNGYVTELVRHVFLDGKEVEREVMRRDIYRGTAAKVLVRNSDD